MAGRQLAGCGGRTVPALARSAAVRLRGGSENALYSLSSGAAYTAAVAGLGAIAIATLRLFRIGGRATLIAGLLAAALLVAFAVELLADAYGDDASVGPAGLCALLVIGSAITHVAAAGAQALRTRRNRAGDGRMQSDG